MKNERQIRQQYQRLAPSLDERTRREWAASEAMAFGHGGIALVHRACGLSRGAIGRGIRDLQAAEEARNDPARTPEVRGGAPRRRRTPLLEREGPGVARGARGVGRAGYARRSRVPPSLDAQESAGARRRARCRRPPDQLPQRRLPPEVPRLLSAGQPQDARGQRPPRSRRPVPLPRRAVGQAARRRPPRAIGGHQEEGAGGPLQERRPGVAPCRRARRGQGT